MLHVIGVNEMYVQQLDSEGEKAMMAWQFKRQEEDKHMKADDGEYSTSIWSSSKALKSELAGMQSIRLL